jgi:hypothetical protein
MWFRWLYLTTVVLVITHQIDSAYWQRLRQYDLPGGGATILVAHLALVALLVWGYQRVHDETRVGLWLSLVACLFGLFAVGTHVTLLVAGRPEYRSTPSLVLLGAIAACCVVQVPATLLRIRPDLVQRTTA